MDITGKQKKVWYDAMVTAGHTPVMADGNLDFFAASVDGHHNGPACSACGWGTCWHCNDVDVIPVCSAHLATVALGYALYDAEHTARLGENPQDQPEYFRRARDILRAIRDYRTPDERYALIRYIEGT